MSFTRFHDDPNRIKYGLQISTFAGRYALDTPGPGVNLPYFEDPQIRIQQWGANLMSNSIALESDLRGLTRPLNRDNIESNNYKNAAEMGDKQSYPKEGHFVEESRASHPAWAYRDLEQKRWEQPVLNPQANVEKRFHDNIQTRILEKDYFVPTVPVLNLPTSSNEETEYYLTGRSLCLGGKCPVYKK